MGSGFSRILSLDLTVFAGHEAGKDEDLHFQISTFRNKPFIRILAGLGEHFANEQHVFENIVDQIHSK